MAFTRREFLGQSAAAASAAALGLAWVDRAWADKTSDIRLAQIGFHGQGGNHIERNHQNLVALCDVDEQVLANKADELQRKHGRKLDTYTDFRKLLERKDIDAVSIATPNHTHAWVAVSAAQAGKHVYVEKPVSHDIWEGRQMVQAARQNNRVMQCGTQSRSSNSLREAVDFVRRGELGKIKYAQGTCYKPRPSIGKLDKPLVIPSTIRLRPLVRTGGQGRALSSSSALRLALGSGTPATATWATRASIKWTSPAGSSARTRSPPRVISIGGRLGYDDAGNTPNTQVVWLDYPTAPLIFETRGLPHSKEGQKNWGHSMDNYRGSRIGVIVQCERGYVLVPSYVEAIAYDNERPPDQALAGPRRLARHGTSRTSSPRWPRTIARSSTPRSTRASVERAVPHGRHLAAARQKGPRRRDRRADPAATNA